MDIASRKELIDRYLAAYNAFDVDGMLALLSPDVRFKNFLGNRLAASAHGLEEFKRLAERAKALFSEREQRITGLDAGPEQTIARIAYRGTLAVDMPNGPRAGTVLNLKGESEFSFADGKICGIIDRT